MTSHFSSIFDDKFELDRFYETNFKELAEYEKLYDQGIIIYDKGKFSRFLGIDIPFYKPNKDEVIYVPDIVTQIESRTFERCCHKKIIIPNSVTYIGYNAFAESLYLTNVILSSKLQKITSGMFFGCSSLIDIVIPDAVTEIEVTAFLWCEKLENVKLSNSLVKIGPCAFENCISLTNITIPDTVIKIEWNAFSNCEKLENIKLSNSLVKIESAAFSNCISLTNIFIPNSVEEIEFGAFKNCTSLQEIIVNDEKRKCIVLNSLDEEQKNKIKIIVNPLLYKFDLKINQFAYQECSDIINNVSNKTKYLAKKIITFYNNNNFEEFCSSFTSYFENVRHYFKDCLNDIYADCSENIAKHIKEKSERTKDKIREIEDCWPSYKPQLVYLGLNDQIKYPIELNLLKNILAENGITCNINYEKKMINIYTNQKGYRESEKKNSKPKQHRLLPNNRQL